LVPAKIRQRLPIDILADDVIVRAIADDVVDLDHVRMRQPRVEPGLDFQSTTAIVGHFVRANPLDRDRAIELRVVPGKHFAHPTAPEPTQVPISADLRRQRPRLCYAHLCFAYGAGCRGRKYRNTAAPAWECSERKTAKLGNPSSCGFTATSDE